MSKKTIIALISYLFFSLLYIHPGEIPLLEKDTTQVLSDGTDPVTFPYQFSFIINRFKESPRDFLYGAILNPYQDAPEGLPLWIPMIERVEVLFLSLFIPVEQISTGLVIIGMTLNGLFMFLLARALSIPNLVSWGMGAAWAFSAYTRARAKVHMGLVGIYHLPLIFLSIILLGKDDRKSKILGTLGFLLISFMPFYYVITLAALTPLILLFIWIQHKIFKKDQRKYFLAIALASLPAILWLSWSILRPLPPEIQISNSPFPTTGEYSTSYHPYLDHFSASPIDYFTGDIGIGTLDLNFIKEKLNIAILKENFNGSNPHERAQGIRWIIWILSTLGMFTFFKKNNSLWDTYDKSLTLFFFLFALCSFWLSMPPNWPIEGLGASLLLHKIIPQIRVPNRAGIGVAFSLIMISGLLLKNILTHTNLESRLKKIIPITFLTIVIFELPPFLQFLPISNLLPPLVSEVNLAGCGLGFSYPYVSSQNSSINFYYLLQRFRGSDCEIINSSIASTLDKKMLEHFSEASIIQEKRTVENETEHLRRFVKCANVSWIMFNSKIQKDALTQMCSALGWSLKNDLFCFNSNSFKNIKVLTINNCL